MVAKKITTAPSQITVGSVYANSTRESLLVLFAKVEVYRKNGWTVETEYNEIPNAHIELIARKD